MRFAGYIYRMDPSSFTLYTFGTRTRDWVRLRRTDCVEADFKILRLTNWETVADPPWAFESIKEEGLCWHWDIFFSQYFYKFQHNLKII
ncbi:hypothetical protein CEXT_592201 [Caerostris extrusa]|uniref:Uncharacterized protein n=1 Tax=Caerostris extrusa TaxID=172846 RepID=A0AAV4RM39_CAEEX|nr:hypothetical protein CEXT_592201 [Caerostris extrusa]